jgi:two-component system sensor histidine kinase DegS
MYVWIPFLPIATIVYIISVISVAIATVIGQSFIQIVLKTHAGDGARINVSGRQRMLSQRVALDTMVSYFSLIQVAIMGQTKDDSKITDKYRASTEGAVALWSSSRIDLVEGNSALTIPVENDQAILDAFDELDGYSENIIADIDALLDPISGVPRKLTDPNVVDELLDLIGLSFEFLKRMNAV